MSRRSFGERRSMRIFYSRLGLYQLCRKPSSVVDNAVGTSNTDLANSSSSSAEIREIQLDAQVWPTVDDL